MKVTALEYHRNGITGLGFYAAIVQDNDKTEKLVVRFGKDVDDEMGNVACAVFDLGMLNAVGSDRIAFGLNSWRGDHYNEVVDKAIAKAEASNV
jgi:hypothetical protein